MTNKDKILEKLRKLMNLKESALSLGNEGEAFAAAAGITRLLIAYNLSETDIPTQERIENPVVAEEIPFKPEISSGIWYQSLIGVVCKYNMCRFSPTGSTKLVRKNILHIGMTACSSSDVDHKALPCTSAPISADAYLA